MISHMTKVNKGSAEKYKRREYMCHNEEFTSAVEATEQLRRFHTT